MTPVQTVAPAFSVNGPNSPQAWHDRRLLGGGIEPCPTITQRYASILNAIDWYWQQMPHARKVILDIAAGVGLVGRLGQQQWPDLEYHATEQDELQRQEIKFRVPGASVALWTFGGPESEPLERTLAEAEDDFERHYPVVVLSHVLEHVPDYYGLLHAAWDFVSPGGVLLVCVPYRDEHETHCSLWDWDKVIGVLRQFNRLGAPLAVWSAGAWSDLLVAVAKHDAEQPEKERR